MFYAYLSGISDFEIVFQTSEKDGVAFLSIVERLPDFSSCISSNDSNR